MLVYGAARPACALAYLRLGDDGAALPPLERIAASAAAGYAPRARIELALLHLRRGDRDGARHWLTEVQKKPLADCDEHELNALARHGTCRR